MKLWVKVLIAALLIVLLAALGYAAYYRLTDVRDKGGMENPDATDYGNFMLDGDGMVNTNAPMEALLEGQWASEDGVWTADIDNYVFQLSYGQEQVYSNSFHFSFDGEDLDAKTEFYLYCGMDWSEDGSVCTSIESLYAENRKLYLDVTVKEAEADGVRYQVVLEPADKSEAAK